MVVVVAHAHGAGGRAVAGDVAHLREQAAGVVEQRAFAAGGDDALDLAPAVVAVGQRVAVGVAPLDQSPVVRLAVGVAFGHAGVAIGPGQAVAVVGDGVVGAGAVGTEVDATAVIEVVIGGAAILADAGDGGTGAQQLAGEFEVRRLQAGDVIRPRRIGAVEAALAVVGAHAFNREAGADQAFVGILQHQVATGDIHIGPLGAAALCCVAG